MLLGLSEGRKVKPPSEIYLPGDLLPYTLSGIPRKYALLLGQCVCIRREHKNKHIVIASHGVVYEE
jgi:hypothetical protein